MNGDAVDRTLELPASNDGAMPFAHLQKTAGVGHLGG